MSDNVQSATEDVIVWINDDEGTSRGNSWQVHKWSTGSPCLVLREDGDVELYGALQRAGPVELENTDPGGGLIVTLRRDGVAVLQFGRIAGLGATVATPAGSDDTLVLRSAADVHFIPDYDDDNTTTGPALIIDTANGDPIAWLTNTGIATWYDDSGNIRMQWHCVLSPTTERLSRLALFGTPQRGHLSIGADVSGGRPGVLVLQDQDGNDYYLWVQNNGTLRILDSDPTTNDSSGVPVGIQTA